MLKQERGSITLFVLIAMLFFTIYLIGMYILSTNSESSQIEEMAKIKEIYEEGVNNIEDIYATLEKREMENNEKEIALDGSWSSTNKVNKPNLENTGLQAIVINADGTTSTPDSKKENWYSYDGVENKWANAQTVDGSMWVWIPRYAYKITYNDGSDKSQGGTIDVVFLQGTSNLDKDGKDVTQASYLDEKGQTGAYIVHPAFEDGSSTGYANGEWRKKIEGIWVAKFEAGYQDADKAVNSNVGYTTIYSYEIDGTEADRTTYYYGERVVGTKIKYPTFTANKPSISYIGISDSYDLCRDLTSMNAPYKLNGNKVDSHLTKNSEWGAVAYLTHSKYGRGGQEVTINNITVNGENTAYAVTGYAGESVSASQLVTNLTAINNNQVEGSWTTAQGQKASTTGNIYGIYDLSGGLWEFTAGYIAPETGNYQTYGGSLKGESNEYKSKYAGVSETAETNYNEIVNKGRIGEAIWETSDSGSTVNGAWNSDYSAFVRSIAPFTVRGSNWSFDSKAGLFAFDRTYGFCRFQVGFRPVLIIE